MQKSGLKIFSLQTILLKRLQKLAPKLKRDRFDFYKLRRNPSSCGSSMIKTLKAINFADMVEKSIKKYGLR